MASTPTTSTPSASAGATAASPMRSRSRGSPRPSGWSSSTTSPSTTTARSTSWPSAPRAPGRRRAATRKAFRWPSRARASRSERLGRRRPLLEHEPVVVEELALEADAVGAHARGERQPEVGAREPARYEPGLEQGLLQAACREPLAPLADRLDVVEPAALAGHKLEVRLRVAYHLLLAEGKAGAGKLAPQQGEVPGVRVARRANVRLLHRNHVAPEDHRLEIKAAAAGQHTRDPREQLAVDLVLAPGAVLVGRAEVLEGAEAGHCVEAAEAVAADLPSVLEVHVQAVPPAGRRLRRRKGDAHPAPATLADERQQRPPATAEVEHPPAGPDADLLGHVAVLAALSLLEAHGEVTVVLGPAEVRQLPETEPEDAVDQRVGEFEVLASGHASGPEPTPTPTQASPGLPTPPEASPGLLSRRKRPPTASLTAGRAANPTASVPARWLAERDRPGSPARGSFRGRGIGAGAVVRRDVRSAAARAPRPPGGLPNRRQRPARGPHSRDDQLLAPLGVGGASAGRRLHGDRPRPDRPRRLGHAPRRLLAGRPCGRHP